MLELPAVRWPPAPARPARESGARPRPLETRRHNRQCADVVHSCSRRDGPGASSRLSLPTSAAPEARRTADRSSRPAAAPSAGTSAPGDPGPLPRHAISEIVTDLVKRPRGLQPARQRTEPIQRDTDAIRSQRGIGRASSQSCNEPSARELPTWVVQVRRGPTLPVSRARVPDRRRRRGATRGPHRGGLSVRLVVARTASRHRAVRSCSKSACVGTMARRTHGRRAEGAARDRRAGRRRRRPPTGRSRSSRPRKTRSARARCGSATWRSTSAASRRAHRGRVAVDPRVG